MRGQSPQSRGIEAHKSREQPYLLLEISDQGPALDMPTLPPGEHAGSARNDPFDEPEWFARRMTVIQSGDILNV